MAGFCWSRYLALRSNSSLKTMGEAQIRPKLRAVSLYLNRPTFSAKLFTIPFQGITWSINALEICCCLFLKFGPQINTVNGCMTRRKTTILIPKALHLMPPETILATMQA